MILNLLKDIINQQQEQPLPETEWNALSSLSSVARTETSVTNRNDPLYLNSFFFSEQEEYLDAV